MLNERELFHPEAVRFMAAHFSLILINSINDWLFLALFTKKGLLSTSLELQPHKNRINYGWHATKLFCLATTASEHKRWFRHLFHSFWFSLSQSLAHWYIFKQVCCCRPFMCFVVWFRIINVRVFTDSCCTLNNPYIPTEFCFCI